MLKKHLITPESLTPFSPLERSVQLLQEDAPAVQVCRVAMRLLHVKSVVLLFVQQGQLQLGGYAGELWPLQEDQIRAQVYAWCAQLVQQSHSLSVQITLPIALSFLGVPLYNSTQHLYGLLGVIEPLVRDWTEEEQNLLADVGSLFSAVVPMSDEHFEVSSPASSGDQEMSVHVESDVLRAILDSIPAMIAVKDTAGRFVYSNPAHTRHINFTNMSQVVGKTDFDVYATAFAQEAQAEEQQILATGQPLIAKHEILEPRTGENIRCAPLEVFTSKIPVFYPDGQLLGICCYSHIPEDPQLQLSTQADDRQFRALIENALDVITILNADGIFLYNSPSVDRVLGYTAQGLIGLNILDFLHPDDYPTVQQHFATILAYPGETVSILCRFKHADGNWRVLEAVGCGRIDRNGEPSITVNSRDVTDRTQAQETLQHERAILARRVAERTMELSAANIELARSARLKDEFLASMSHELRTPLNAILGLSEALQEQVYGPVSAQQARILHSIEESGQHLLTLINDILDLSKIEAGKLELQLVRVDVQDICQASIRLVHQVALQKRITVSMSIESQALQIVADERRLKQILVNLLSNAVKFTPDEGEVGIEVVGDNEEHLLRFTVWDTGIGITQSDLRRLFRPFVQLDSSLSRQYAGTGLGLALVHRMVELHGGGISIESEVGKGSRFTVWLPWRQEEMPPEPLPEEKPIAAPRLHVAETHVINGIESASTILVAEDNEQNILVLVDYLERHQYRVIVARNGFEAVAMTQQEHPDLILMDMQMPAMDGLEATRRIRADAVIATTPIIALTALAMKGDRERCLAVGANDYLSKPVRLLQLHKAIQQYLPMVTEE